MAKHCNVCDTDYADEHQFCPHCATKVSPARGSAAKSEEQHGETVQQPFTAEDVASFDTEPVDMDAVLKDVPTSPTEHFEATPTMDVPGTPTLVRPPAAGEPEEPAQFATTRDITELYRAAQTAPAPSGTPTPFAPGAAVTQLAKPADMEAAARQPPAAGA